MASHILGWLDDNQVISAGFCAITTLENNQIRIKPVRAIPLVRSGRDRSDLEIQSDFNYLCNRLENVFFFFEKC